MNNNHKSRSENLLSKSQLAVIWNIPTEDPDPDSDSDPDPGPDQDPDPQKSFYRNFWQGWSGGQKTTLEIKTNFAQVQLVTLSYLKPTIL